MIGHSGKMAVSYIVVCNGDANTLPITTILPFYVHATLLLMAITTPISISLSYLLVGPQIMQTTSPTFAQYQIRPNGIR